MFFLEGRIALPADLQALYQLYQQELHSTTQSERETIHNSAQTPKLPQINEGHFARRLRASSLDNGSFLGRFYFMILTIVLC